MDSNDFLLITQFFAVMIISFSVFGLKLPVWIFGTKTLILINYFVECVEEFNGFLEYPFSLTTQNLHTKNTIHSKIKRMLEIQTTREERRRTWTIKNYLENLTNWIRIMLVDLKRKLIDVLLKSLKHWLSIKD